MPGPMATGQSKVPGLGLALGGLGGKPKGFGPGGGQALPGIGGGFGLDLGKLTAQPDPAAADPQGFQDEFMLQADQFSESWRMALGREKRF